MESLSVEKIKNNTWKYGKWTIIKLNGLFSGKLCAYHSKPQTEQYFFNESDYPTIISLCQKLDALEATFITTEWDIE